VKQPLTPQVSQTEASAMFQRTRNGWVMDSLRLGRRGLDRPSARTGKAQPARGGIFTLRRGDTRAAG